METLPDLPDLPSLSQIEFEDIHLPNVLQILTVSADDASKESILHALRLLRNALALKLLKSREKRRTMTDTVWKLFPIVFKETKPECEDEMLLACITCSLQVFINSFACRQDDSLDIPSLQEVISHLVTSHGVDLLSHSHSKISSYSALLFSYSMNEGGVNSPNWEIFLNQETLSSILDKLLSSDDNNSLIFLESIVKQHHLTIVNLYLTFNIDHRYFLIQCIDSVQNIASIHQDLALFLAALFSNQSESLITRADNNCDSVKETLAILQLLAKLSDNSASFPLLRRDTVFIKSCVNTLKLSLEAGERDATSCFASIGKCSRSQEAAVDNSLVYGLKKNLITCLGNLAHGDRENQTLIGQELEALPLILSCTNIDERNPFIQQWAVLAVKLLVENHEANQKILSEMRPVS